MSDKINKAFATNRLPNGGLIYGISDHQKTAEINIRTYPNPTSDHLTVDFGNEVPLGKTTLELLTTEGTCIRTFNLVQAASRNQIVTADIPEGFYFLRVTTKGIPTVKKVVVIH